MHKLPVRPERGRARAHKLPTEGLDADGRQKVTYKQSTNQSYRALIIVSILLYIYQKICAYDSKAHAGANRCNSHVCLTLLSLSHCGDRDVWARVCCTKQCMARNRTGKYNCIRPMTRTFTRTGCNKQGTFSSLIIT